MCGIAGHLGERRLDDQRASRCLELMRHRGPDASGIYRATPGPGRHLTLLHRRLSIIDLDPRSDQPMRLERTVIACNGELYNYRELRERRGWTGGTCATTSDTEILQRVLGRDGAAGLDDCEGMWAFAFYDERDGSLLLGRDRFGEKPLYLLEQGDELYFGSEIKFIAALLGRRLSIDEQHLYRYLVNGYKALYKNGAGFFTEVRELPPATTLRIDAEDGRAESRYWHIGSGDEADMTYAEAVEAARLALLRSVELRLRADVPLAFLMSGGVDSNALIGLARRGLGRDVHGFTVVNTDARYDERDLVERSARELEIRHTAVPLSTDEFLPRLRRLVEQHDAPVYTITYYAQWLLMQAVADAGYRITISGTAADELFSGYYDHHLAYLYDLRDDPAHAPARAAWEQHIRPLVRNPHLQDPDLFVRDPGFRDHIYLDAEWFGASLTAPWNEPFSETPYRQSVLRNRMLNELFHESVPAILHEDDLNAMSVSIENRSPYLDRQLYELCQAIPTRHLIRDGFAKAVLRDAARGFAPDSIIDERRKVGFNAPIRSFLDTRDPAVRGEILADGPIWEHVRKPVIEGLLDQDELPNSRSKFLFYFLNAKLFLESFAA